MNLKELYEIIEKFDKPELWEIKRHPITNLERQMGSHQGSIVFPDAGIIARRKVVTAAYDSISEQIKLAGGEVAE